MAKTTKKARGIHSWVKFQKHQGVESLTIQGKDVLADLSQDKNGDTNLILNADKDKVNTIVSSVPFLGISHTITGADPNQEKTATISQDLAQFPLSGGELVTVTKTETNLTIHDEKVKEFVNTTLSAKETELKEFVTEHTAGAVGVSPSYVADEINKVKEELTAKINEHAGGGSSPQPQPVKSVTNIASGSPLDSSNTPTQDSAYKFNLTGLYTMSFRPAFIANISYVVKSTNEFHQTTVYVSEKDSLTVKEGALTFKVSFDKIEMIFDEKVYDVTMQGTIFDNVTVTDDTFVIRIDKTYTPTSPQPELDGNKPEPIADRKSVV